MEWSESKSYPPHHYHTTTAAHSSSSSRPSSSSSSSTPPVSSGVNRLYIFLSWQTYCITVQFPCIIFFTWTIDYQCIYRSYCCCRSRKEDNDYVSFWTVWESSLLHFTEWWWDVFCMCIYFTQPVNLPGIPTKTTIISFALPCMNVTYRNPSFFPPPSPIYT